MEKTYDFCVIGGGYGGLIASLNALRNGLTIAIVERRSRIGGTCLFEGCIPSKCLLNSSYKYYEAKHVMGKHGVICENVSHDYDAMMKKKFDLLDTMGANNTNKLKSLGAEIFRGWGKVHSKNEVEVIEVDEDGKANGKKSIIHCKNIILNMGGESATLPGNSIPVDGINVITSEHALSLKKLPKTMIIVGGGFIGLELGSHYSRLGTEVTVIEFFDRVLTVFDGDLSKKIKEILESQGMKFQLSSKVVGGKSLDNHVEVIVEDAAGGNKRTLFAEKLFIATGRRPMTRNCGLEEIGVQLDKFGRVLVNEKLQSTVENIYAIGDVSANGPPLAHKAEDEALALVDQYLGKKFLCNICLCAFFFIKKY
jgi:dihydrolipoamide dehydrogenase